MSLNTTRQLLIIFINITAIVTFAESSCECVDSLIHIVPTRQGKDNCYLDDLNELLKNESVPNFYSACGNPKFIIHQGLYVVDKDTKSLPNKKANINQIDIRGESSATIKCEENVSFKVTRTFGKANTMSIHNIEFRNCKEVLLESNLKEAKVEIKNCNFSTSCLRFNFTKNIKVADILISNTLIINCSCSDGIVQISSTVALHSNITFHGMTVTDNQSPLLIIGKPPICISVMLRGRCVFQDNRDFKIQMEAGSKLLFFGAEVHFNNNRLNVSAQGTTIMAKQATITFEDSAVTFKQNKGSPSGGIVAMDSTQIIIKDNVSIGFIENIGLNGGALSFYTESTLLFNATQSNIIINFTNNTASFGGGIFVEDRGYAEVRSVFDLQGDNKLVKLSFENNSALFEGHQIYGGWIWLTDEREDVTQMLTFDNDVDDPNLVASDPVRICLCSNDMDKGYIMECNRTEPTITIHGCILDLALVAVGQNFTPVVAYVEAIIKSGSNVSDRLRVVSPRIENIQKTCTNVRYKVDSRFQGETIRLLLNPYLDYARPPKRFNDSISQLLFTQLTIHLKKEDCALGYVKKENSCECVCLPSLKSIELSCRNGYVVRSKKQWVGVINTTSRHRVVIARKYCPFDYCKTDENPLLISLKDPDKQCAFNRSGILCGGCKTGFSRLLASSKCEKCSNHKLIVIIPCVLLAGLILVILLILLDLTVSVGTISGLIFYANIIRAQHVTFFNSETRLSVFIAWLNFDLGIETCLFDGLDSYVENWLQFCFPLYIWIIVFTIIVSSHYSMKISKLCGKNIVSVLATLFLLSYTKLLRLVIDVVTFTRIKYPDGHTKLVWFYDGNVDYLKSKHIPLFLATLLLQIFLAVFPLSLISIQWLYKISHYRVMSWVQRLKPFFDAYTGPYRANHRYWTGLLLIIRVILLMIFTLKRNTSPIHDLFAIMVISFGLLTYLAATRGIYKNTFPNYLELFFLCNLGLTSAAVQYEFASNAHSSVSIKLSTGVTALVFVGIIAFHALRQILKIPFGARMQNNVMRLISLKKEVSRDIQLPPGSAQVTSTIIELKEPLIEC